MARNAPGKRFRKGMSRVEAVLLFLDDAAVEQRFAEVRPGRTGRGIRIANQATSGTKPPTGACAFAAAQAASDSRFPPGPSAAAPPDADPTRKSLPKGATGSSFGTCGMALA